MNLLTHVVGKDEDNVWLYAGARAEEGGGEGAVALVEREIAADREPAAAEGAFFGVVFARQKSSLTVAGRSPDARRGGKLTHKTHARSTLAEEASDRC